ncbi:MAG: hypothetical protein ACOC0N_10200 [Chroococcales cyanobacterium]
MSNNNKIASGKLAKAKLIPASNQEGADTIEFMFNPTELTFQQSVNLTQSDGSYTDSGLPKVSFSSPNPCTLSLSNLLFDTYEEGTSVLTHVGKLIKAIEFADRGKAKGKRPPIYIFTWGDYQYLRCFVEQITYRLTLFLPDGTPVQAKVDMTLKEVDDSSTSSTGASANRSGDSRQNRLVFGR